MLEARFASLIDEQIDVAIRVGHLPDSSYVARRLGDMQWLVCAGPAYLERCGLPQTPQDLQDHNCIHYQNNTHAMDTWPFRRGDKEYRVKVNGSLVVDDASALVSAAEEGMGICARAAVKRLTLFCKRGIFAGSLYTLCGFARGISRVGACCGRRNYGGW